MTQLTSFSYTRIGLVAAVIVFATVLAGCSHDTTATNSATTNASTTNAESATTKTSNDSTSLAVPAPGFENANETAVNTDANGNTNVVADVEDANAKIIVETAAEEPIPPAVTELSMTARQFEFSPATLTVSKGDSVRLSITSEDVTHGFSLPAFDVNATLKAGQTTTVEFEATETGTFPFACSVFCGANHPQMEGTLIVQ